jgi:hypothetical protein
VPVSTTITLAAATRTAFLLADRLAGPRTTRASAAVLAGAVTIGLAVVGSDRLTQLSPEPQRANLERIVARQRTPGDLYLIPLERLQFRIDAGVPVFVDMKTHPYKDRELLEWFRRVRQVAEVYAGGGSLGPSQVSGSQLRCGPLAELARRERLSNVVVREVRRRPECGFLSQGRRTGGYTVYRIETARR